MIYRPAALNYLRNIFTAPPSGGYFRSRFAQYVILALIVDDNFKKLIEMQRDMIKQRTNSDVVFIGSKQDKDYKNNFEEKIKGKYLKILFTKV